MPIKLVCPYCGSTLKSTQDIQFFAGKNVRCNVCKNISPFEKYRTMQIPDEQSDESTTVVGNLPKKCEVIGSLVEVATGESQRLKLGENVIGRRSPSSKADIQYASENRRISREHIIIDVKDDPTEGYVHIISLYKSAVNVTKLDDTQLLAGDAYVLKSGAIIHLPGLDLRFEIPDNDATIYN